MNQLIHTPEHGHVWHTDCAKCGTRQKIRIGNCTLAHATAAVEKLDNSPMECPGGYHTELSGWRNRWHLDAMLAALAALQPQPVIEVKAEIVPPETPGAESAPSAPSADKTPPAVPLITVGTDNSRVTAAKNIRLELAHHFPGIKFSVKGSTFSMGDAIDVHWTMGPTANEVDAIIDRYQECDFDGSDDSTHYRTGEARKFTDAHGGAKYVNGHRCTRDACRVLCWHLCKALGIETPSEDPAADHSYSAIRYDRYNENLSTMVHRMLGSASFPPGAIITGIQPNTDTTNIHRQEYMPRFDALNPDAPIPAPVTGKTPKARKKTTVAAGIEDSTGTKAPASPSLQVPKSPDRPAATPQGDLIRKIPFGTFAFLSGQPDGTPVRAAFATWVDAGSHTSDWRKLFAEYQKETVSLSAPAAAAEAPATETAAEAPVTFKTADGHDGIKAVCDWLNEDDEDPGQGACILTAGNMHTADDCTSHDHEPAAPEQQPTNILHFTPSTDATPTAAQLAMERLRRAAQRTH